MKKQVDKKIDVSVIIPLLVQHPNLTSTLRCLENQKKKFDFSYEILILDASSENSTDTSYDTLFDNECIHYQRMQHTTNFSFICNIGGSLANGNVLVFLDQNILVPPDFLSSCLSNLKNDVNEVMLFRHRILKDVSNSDTFTEDVCDNFGILDKYPSYIKNQDIPLFDSSRVGVPRTDNWYLISFDHLALHKSFYFACGGLEEAFRAYHCLEDREFGIRLIRNNAKLVINDSLICYKRPCKLLSEKLTAQPNRWLLSALHQCSEVEILSVLQNTANENIQTIRNIRRESLPSNSSNLTRFDIILGAIRFLDDKTIPRKSNQYLGVCLPLIQNAAISKALILRNFFSFRREMQFLLLMEGFRVARELYIDIPDKNARNQLLQTLSYWGFVVRIRAKGKYSRLIIKNKNPLRFFTLLLPPIENHAERSYYMQLAVQLQNYKAVIFMNDINNFVEFDNSDYRLSKEDQSLLFSQVIVNSQISHGALIAPNSRISHIQAISQTQKNRIYITDSESFGKSIDTSAIPNAIGIPNSILELSKICYVRKEVKKCIRVIKSPKREGVNFGCFLRNGYLEDGIDIILEAFAGLVARRNVARLIIRVSDYDKCLKQNFSETNKYSSINTTSNIECSTEQVYNQIVKQIQARSLENHVVCKRGNDTFETILKEMNELDGMICATRSVKTPIEVYAAIFLQKFVFTHSELELPSYFHQFVQQVPVIVEPFSKALCLPETSENSSVCAYSLNTKFLINAIEEGWHKNILKNLNHPFFGKANKSLTAFFDKL